MPKYCKHLFSFFPLIMINFFIFFSFLLIGFTVKSETAGSVTGLNGTEGDSPKLVYNIGLVNVDVNSKMVAMANICLSIALSDFYAKNLNYQTRLSLQTWDSLGAASAVEYLPQTSAKTSKAIKLGDSPSPLLIKTSMSDDFSRLAKATVSTLEMFEWNEAILVYEEMEFYDAIIPYLTDALEYKGIQLSHRTAIPTSAQAFQILEQLQLLITLQSKVFVVHMSTNLASRFFDVANKAGMMTKGFGWLVIDGLSLSNSIDSMEGVIGLRPYVSKTKALKNFRTRYKSLSMMMKQYNKVDTELNLFGLWVYDIIWGLANTVEITTGHREINSSFLNTTFRGISGEFDMVNGQIQPSVFGIFNITQKGERMVGYWSSHDQGISKTLYPTSRNKLRTRRTLAANESIRSTWKIGVPSKTGFKEFVNLNENGKNDDELPGFSIEVFEAIWKSVALPPNTHYEFVTIDGTYGDLCCLVKDKQINAAVEDISIVSSRTNCVDFTLPYLESGVAMLIKVRHDGPKDMWIFLKPLSWDLWLVIIAIFVFIGIVVRVLDRRENTEFNGSPREQLSTILMFPCLSVTIPQRDMVVTNWSRLVLVVWIFLAFILMQSYTANLSSILTVNQLQPTIPSMKELRKCNVGYQNLSFVKDFLIHQLDFKESMLKPYGSADDYHEALSKGSENGGVSAIFDEIPYIKLFLAQYSTGYQMIGPTYRTDGLGFALPIGSQLVANFSRAILNFTQGKYMAPIEKKYFGRISIDQEETTGEISSATPSLTSRSFAGLFIIITVVVFLALLISENHMLGRFIGRYIFRNSRDVSGSRVQTTAEMTDTTVTNSPEINIVEENHNSNMNNRDESREEAVLDVQSS